MGGSRSDMGGKDFFQFLFSLVDMPGDRGFGAVEDFGRFGMIESFKIGEDQSLPLLFLELTQAFVEQGMALARIRRGHLVDWGRLVLPDNRHGWSALTLAEPIPGSIDRNPAEPVLKRCLSAEFGQAASRFDKGLLDQILGVLLVAGETVKHPVNHLVVAVKEAPESGFITGLRGLNPMRFIVFMAQLDHWGQTVPDLNRKAP